MTGYVSTINPYTAWMSNAIGDGSLGFGNSALGLQPNIMGSCSNLFPSQGFTGSYINPFGSQGGFNYGMGQCDLTTEEGRRKYIKMQKEMANAQRALDRNNQKNQLEDQKIAQTNQFKSQATQVQLSDLLTRLHTAIANDEKDEAKDIYNQAVNVYSKLLDAGNFETDANGNEIKGNILDKSQVKAQLNEMYKQFSGGKSLSDDMEESCSSDFTTGMNCLNPWGDKVRKSQLKELIDGTKTKHPDIAKTAGAATSGILT